MNNYLLIFFGILLLITVSYLIGRLHQRKGTGTPQDSIALYQEIQSLPGKVLAAIQGSINPQKGKIAELLTYARIRYDYDIIIPLGQPIDFIGIKKGEKIDFIEVKSGNSRQLTDGEAEIEKLIRAGRVHFRLLSVKDEELHRENNETNH